MERLKLNIGYIKDNKTLYQDMEITIPTNGIISIIGDNGSGKSTLYKTLSGIIPPVKGVVPKHIAQKMAVISDYVHLPEEVSVWDVLCLLGDKKIKYAEVTYSDFHQYIMQYKNQRLKTLSSGQRRIVEIYAVLASGKKIVILDEASNSLDFINRELLLNHVKKLAFGKILFFHTSHEIHDVVFLGGTIYGLFKTDGVMRQYTGGLTSDNLHHFLGYGENS